ncbi:wax ester/triacylglycerol synthase domain-containing protein [Dactylosporangium sp. McL0621]|uniref:wax ester/triacylglycerol synthase domain-containing protein n=1 Tax=Dactylosporangium sp. McL0621 TaxID=3415678 RepID=UPI003CF4B76F
MAAARALDRLSAFDLTSLAVEAPDTPMHVGVVALLDGHPPLADIRARILDGVRAVPRLRQVVSRSARRPRWVDDPDFRVEEHVVPVAVEPPGGEAELLRLTAGLMAVPLDRSRPLWRVWVVTGLPERRLALVVALHHAIGDGMAAMRIIGTLLDPSSAAAVPTPLAARSRRLAGPTPSSAAAVPTPLAARSRRLAGPTPSSAAAVPTPLAARSRRLAGPTPSSAAAVPTPLAARSRRLAGPTPSSAAAVPVPSAARSRRRAVGPGARRSPRAVWRALRQTRSAPRTSLNAPIGAGRRLGVIRLALAEARAVAHDAGGKVNDVILGLIGGGLRSLLQTRGEPVEGVALRVAVAVSLREPGEPAAYGNQNGSIIVRLRLGGTDPGARLRAVAAATTRAKREQAAIAQQHCMVLAARAGLARRMSRTQRMVNLVESNLPGPPAPIVALGTPVLYLLPIGAIAGNLTIAFLALSYAGELIITAIADRDRVPDLPVVLAGMRREWHTLRSAASGNGTRVGTFGPAAGSSGA